MKNRPLCAISVCVRVSVSGAMVAVSLAEVTGVLQPQGCSEAGLVWGESQAAHPSPPQSRHPTLVGSYRCCCSPKSPSLLDVTQFHLT